MMKSTVDTRSLAYIALFAAILAMLIGIWAAERANNLTTEVHQLKQEQQK